MLDLGTLDRFVNKLEQRLRDLKLDYKIEPLSKDSDFIDELLKNFEALYEAAAEAEEQADTITELKIYCKRSTR